MAKRAHVLKSDKYHVIRELGRGGMGVVYLAEDKTLQREVALKVLYEHLNRQSIFSARFQEEARSVSTLHHPNIVYINGLAQTETEVAIDMEYVEGQSLRELADNSRISPHIAVAIARDVLNGLATCHSIGIVHRDIKPSNILINRAGTAKLTDFGLATAYASHLEETVKSDTSSGFYMGTPRYMPVQAWEGSPPQPCWDLYSFGLVLYELLSGELVFPGNSPLEILRKQAKNPIPDLGVLKGKVSPELIDVVGLMLRSTSDDAPSGGSGQALVALESTTECAELSSSNSTPTIPLPPPRIRRRPLRRWIQAKRPWLVGAGGALLVLLALVWAQSVRSPEQPHTRSQRPGASGIPVGASIPVGARELYVDAPVIDSDGKSTSGHWRIALDEQGTPTWIMGFTDTGFWSVDTRDSPDRHCWQIAGHWGRYASPNPGSLQHGTISGTLVWKRGMDSIAISMHCLSTLDGSRLQENLVLWLNESHQDTYRFVREMEADSGIQCLLYTHLLKRNLAWADRIHAFLPSIPGGRLYAPKSVVEVTVDGVLDESVWAEKFAWDRGRVGLVAAQVPHTDLSLHARWSDDFLILGASAPGMTRNSQIEVAFAPGVGSIEDWAHQFFLTLSSDGRSQSRYFVEGRQFSWDNFGGALHGKDWEIAVGESGDVSQFEVRIPLKELSSVFTVEQGAHWRINVRWTQENADGTRTLVGQWGEENLMALSHGILLILEGDGQ